MVDFSNAEMRIVSFYGLQGTVACLTEAFDILVEMSRQYGCEPTRMSTTGRLVGFKNAARKAKDSKFDRLRSFEFISLPFGAENHLQGIDVSASINFHPNADIVVVEIRTEVLHGRLSEFLNACRQVAFLTRPTYGIGFLREFRKGPSLFARGAEYNGTAKDDKEMLGNHFNNLLDKFYRTKGLLSDLFPWNFLTAAQLDRAVEKLSFHDWIVADPERGTLSKFTEELWLWELTPEQIVVQRPVLKAAGRILNHWHEADLRRQEDIEKGNPPLTDATLLQGLVGNSNSADVGIIAFGGNQPPRELTNKEKSAILKRPS